MTTNQGDAGGADALRPPQHIVDLAVQVSGWSPCRSKRGVVIFSGEQRKLGIV